jgi:hypothetical protein
MSLLRILILCTALLSAAASDAGAQQATEIFIPIGQSPGLSGTHTLIGTIDAVDLQNRTITMTDAAGASHTVRFAEDTRFWLDQSQRKVLNTEGAPADLLAGRRIEVYLGRDENAAEPADWIKIEVTGAG